MIKLKNDKNIITIIRQTYKTDISMRFFTMFRMTISNL